MRDREREHVSETERKRENCCVRGMLKSILGFPIALLDHSLEIGFVCRKKAGLCRSCTSEAIIVMIDYATRLNRGLRKPASSVVLCSRTLSRRNDIFSIRSSNIKSRFAEKTTIQSPAAGANENSTTTVNIGCSSKLSRCPAKRG